MAIFSKFLSEMFYKGGFLSAGAAFLLLNKYGCLPRFTLPFSCGLVGTGLIGVIMSVRYYCIRLLDKDPGHDARMEEFYRLKPELEKCILEHEILRMEYHRKENERSSLECERILCTCEQRIAEFESEKVDRNPVMDNMAEVQNLLSIQSQALNKLSNF